MSTIDNAPCPACSTPPGSLSLTETLEARPLGTWSLAGAQLKTSARSAPVLNCSVCGLRVVGEYDPDGHHVTFPNTP